mgnify:CR=1 FL=1
MQNHYEQFTDEELIVRLRDGEEEITDYILNKYKNLSLSTPSSLKIAPALPSETLIKPNKICSVPI